MSRERLKNAPAGDATAHLGHHHRTGGLLLISRPFEHVRSSNLPQRRENAFPLSRAEDLSKKDLLSVENDLRITSVGYCERGLCGAEISDSERKKRSISTPTHHMT